MSFDSWLHIIEGAMVLGILLVTRYVVISTKKKGPPP